MKSMKISTFNKTVQIQNLLSKSKSQEVFDMYYGSPRVQQQKKIITTRDDTNNSGSDTSQKRLTRSKPQFLSLEKIGKSISINIQSETRSTFATQNNPTQVESDKESKVTFVRQQKQGPKILVKSNLTATQVPIQAKPKRKIVNVTTKHTEPDQLHKLQRNWNHMIQQTLDLVTQGRNIQHQILDQGTILSHISKVLEKCMIHVDNINNLTFENLLLDNQWVHLQELLLLLKSLEVKDIYLMLLIIKSKSLKELGDIYEAITMFKTSKRLAQRCKNFQAKMRVYKYLGACYLAVHQYQSALSCYLKMINLSWYLKDVSYELLAYDKLALCFYYLGDINTSKILHERMVYAKLEPNNSQPKLYGLYRVGSQVKFEQNENNHKYLKEQKTIQQQILSESSSEEKDSYIKELVQTEIMSREIIRIRPKSYLQQTNFKISLDELYIEKKFSRPNRQMIMHNSYNRRSSNYQTMCNSDLITKKIQKNKDFKFFWTKQKKKHFDKYKYRMQKFKYMLTTLLNSFLAQLNKNNSPKNNKLENSIRRRGLQYV